ncbi:hypothetical protein HOY34_13355 [Xinfangfangia sp. D13-10-4-6]|uniref:hypothetical protein n=1 Tax=Pseudogemmobacter hezensis TaxID=2737662 RepID=UPI0015550063|nr:hypothetical protein [Pseudogemmobacter hezensis]NPD16184.1 hypothetical protein [Pseudogemmobacter hezensis]
MTGKSKDSDNSLYGFKDKLSLSIILNALEKGIGETHSILSVIEHTLMAEIVSSIENEPQSLITMPIRDNTKTQLGLQEIGRVLQRLQDLQSLARQLADSLIDHASPIEATILGRSAKLAEIRALFGINEPEIQKGAIRDILF